MQPSLTLLGEVNRRTHEIPSLSSSYAWWYCPLNSKNHKLLVVRAECSSPSQPNRRPSQFQYELRFRPSVTQQKTVHDSSPSQPNRRRHCCIIHQRLHDSRRRPAPQSKARLCFNSGHKNRLLLYILRLSPFFTKIV